jgi:hypothetical protein
MNLEVSSCVSCNGLGERTIVEDFRRWLAVPFLLLCGLIVWLSVSVLKVEYGMRNLQWLGLFRQWPQWQTDGTAQNNISHSTITVFVQGSSTVSAPPPAPPDAQVEIQRALMKNVGTRLNGDSVFSGSNKLQ